MSSDTRRRYLWITVFTLAMAQLEATVVVYLRQLYYPEGFEFPLVIIRDRIAAIEIGREAATIVMLLMLARIAAADAWRRFAVFLVAFGLWDVFYYFWLWVMLQWPPSLLTFDVLFLIPLPWVGPVLAPVLISAVMIVAGIGIETLRDAGRTVRVRPGEWWVVAAGAVALLVIFMLDAGSVVHGRLPRPFPWPAFAVALALPSLAALRSYRRSRR